MTKFDQLMEMYGEISDIGHASAVLGWDQHVYMPPKGAEARGQQLATLAAISHERFTGDCMGGLLEEVLAGQDGLTEDQRLAVKELKYRRDRAVKLPESLVREMTEAEARAYGIWVEARQAQDFQEFAPQLSVLLKLARQAADCYGYEGTPWDALADDYERGMTAARITEYFAPLRDATVQLLAAIAEKPQVSTGFLRGSWDVDAQREFGLRIARDIGYDLAAGRLDTTAHPFCTNFSRNDVRITTRYDEQKALEAVFGIIHEAGHALYEQGFRAEDERTPLCHTPSLGVHESQSRFWEVRVGRSRAFWKHYLPIMRQYFPGKLEGVSEEAMYRAANAVERGLIRVEGDEVCYNLHIIIRFELEVAMLDGSLPVDQIPEEWNRRYKEYLGVDVPNDAVGCLQDVHWSHGSFGYFPSYTFGNIYGAMVVEKMDGEIGGLSGQVAEGRFAPALQWLRQNIHRAGARWEPLELMRRVTGQEVTAEPLIKYLRAKYSEIYGL